MILAEAYERNQSLATQSSQAEIDVNPLLIKANRLLRPFHMMISRKIYEKESKIYFALINTADSNLAKMNSSWDANDLKYFKILVKAIQESEEDKTIPLTRAVNYRPQAVTISNAEQLINNWVSNMWLEEFNGTSIGLGVRYLIDMNLLH